jgi:hypothetical protein
VENHSSLRGAAKNIKLFSPENVPTPSHTTIYNWIMKLGVGNYIKRSTGPKYHSFIIDCTIGYGTKKLLLILGIRNSDIKNAKVCYSHKDVDVLRVEVLSKVNGTVVENILNKTAHMHGKPVHIIADGGSDIKKGINNFCANNPGTVYTYDVTHKCALILKHILNKDEEWKLFHALCGECRKKLINTELFSYTPPKARDKSRHLNLDRYIKWMDKILYVSNLKQNRESEKFCKVFGWVKKYKKRLKVWREIMKLLDIVKKEIKQNGLRTNTADIFKEEVQKEFAIVAGTTEDIYSEILDYIEKETAPIPEDKTWPGCSDIIESIFGRFKNYAKNTPFKEITRMVMAIPIFTNEITIDKIQRALEFKTVKKTTKWLQNNIGETMMIKRHNAFRIRRINNS